jgi:hypothetical protein
MQSNFNDLHSQVWAQEITRSKNDSEVRVRVRTSDGRRAVYFVALQPTLGFIALANANGSENERDREVLK